MEPTPALPFRQIGKVIRDSEVHVLFEASLTSLRIQHPHLAPRLDIPAHRELVLQDNTQWWEARKDRYPEGYEQCNTLITERILPMPEAVRHKIIDLFCIPKSIAALKASREDEDCLLRCYLGRRKENFAFPSRYFTLRNKPLAIHQLEDLEAPVVEYANAMADALAVLYWHCKVDANDVEFVLAPEREGEDAWENETLGRHRLWLLDFDCVKTMSMDEAGIEQAAKAFYRNDPYCPRPDGYNEVDDEMWAIFSKRFLATSEMVLGDSELPGRMIDALERLGMERGLRRSKLRREVAEE